MKRIKILGYVTAILIITVFSAQPVLAAAGKAETAKPYYTGGNSGNTRDSFKHERYDRFFDRLVTEGKISAEQKDAIKSAAEAAVKNAKQNGGGSIDMRNVLSGLVKEGKITGEQKAMIESALAAAKLQAAESRLNSALKSLVSAGAMTEAQEKAVKSAVADALQAQNGTVELAAILDNLAKNGVISADQRTALENALKPGPHGKHLNKPNPPEKTANPA